MKKFLPYIATFFAVVIAAVNLMQIINRSKSHSDQVAVQQARVDPDLYKYTGRQDQQLLWLNWFRSKNDTIVSIMTRCNKLLKGADLAQALNAQSNAVNKLLLLFLRGDTPIIPNNTNQTK